jgi:uncharacterized protein (TIGR03435 family)
MKLFATAVIIATSGMFAQAPQSDPAGAGPSAVVSIKPSKPNEPGGFSITTGRFQASNVTARFLIAIAYEVQSFQVIGGPSWVDVDRFDVEAKLEDAERDNGQERAMIQSLLADRFKLVLHRQEGETSVYALVVGPKGPTGLKIKLSANQTLGATPTGGVRIAPGILVATGMRLGLMASLLGTRLGRTVIDRTNLPERYDIDLRWTPDVGEVRAGPPDASPPPDPSGPSLFTAIQQQLGLKLQSIKGPSGFLVIDRMEKSSEN